MLSKLSNKISLFFIKKNYIKKENEEMYNYCFEILLSTIFNLLAIVVLAVITKRYLESLIFTVVFMTLRNYSGGYHAKTHIACFLSLMLIYGILIGLLYLPTKILLILGAIGEGLSFVTILILAPVEATNKPLGKVERLKMKKKNIVALFVFEIVGMIFLFFDITIKLGFVVGFVLCAIGSLLCMGALDNLFCRYRERCYPQIEEDEPKTT